MHSTPDSLVLGFAASLDADSFRPFVNSLRATGFRGKFGLITAKCSPEQRRQLAALADIHWDVDAEFLGQNATTWATPALRRMRNTRGARRAYPLAFQALARVGPERTVQARWERLEYEMEGLQSLRYRLYHEFLQTYAPDADLILLSDLRDVVFQADPFSEPVRGLEVYLEDEASKLGSDPFNSRWLIDLYGETGLHRIANQCTSCSGTTVGDRRAILDYLMQMSLAIQWRRRPMGSHDQGVHNWLLRSGRLREARIVANARGRVLTMGLMPGIKRAADGTVLNDDGSIPSILHQYDRHPELAAELLAVVGARKF